MDFKTMNTDEFKDLFDKLNVFPEADPNKLVLLTEVDWSSSKQKHLTCIHHTWVRYVTKNPWDRGMHLVQGPHGINAIIDPECECRFDDLRVVLGVKDA
jgi:hypothetical protein